MGRVCNRSLWEAAQGRAQGNPVLWFETLDPTAWKSTLAASFCGWIDHAFVFRTAHADAAQAHNSHQIPALDRRGCIRIEHFRKARESLPTNA